MSGRKAFPSKCFEITSAFNTTFSRGATSSTCVQVITKHKSSGTQPTHGMQRVSNMLSIYPKSEGGGNVVRGTLCLEQFCRGELRHTFS